MSQTDSDELTDLEKAERAAALVGQIDSPTNGLKAKADEILDDLVAELLDEEQ